MLTSSGKRVLLSIHIVLISVWIGTLLAILILLLLKQNAFTPSQFATVDKSVFMLFDYIVMNISIIVAVSGLLFSMFTSWGFFRFRWIVTKWVAIVLLALFLMFFVSPSINGMAALSDVFREKVANNPDYLNFQQQSIYYTLAQLVILTLVVSISVIKPWGQRKQRKVINRKIILTFGILFGITLAASILIQYQQLNYFRSLKINEIDLNRLADGSYSAKVNYGHEYTAEVSIENRVINKIEFPGNRKSFYARMAEKIRYKIINEQNVNTDAVTGATTTSKILMKAVEKALDTDI